MSEAIEAQLNTLRWSHHSFTMTKQPHILTVQLSAQGLLMLIVLHIQYSC